MISANTEQINVPVLPVGMARVAASAEQAGHRVRILNLMRPEHVAGALSETVQSFRPDVIGVSVRNIDDQKIGATNFLLPPAKKIIEECRRTSKAPLVLGGPGYSIFPQAALDYLEADFGIKGEGEHAFCLLLERLAGHRPVSDVPGIVLPEGGSKTPPQRIKRLEDYPLPDPAVHLDVPKDVDRDQIWVPFQTRRGCPLNCSYCSTPAIEGRVTRRLAIPAAVESLKSYKDAGYRRVFFVDNTFNLPPGYTESFCEALIEANLDISWQAIIYPFRIKPNLAEKMARAGCAGVSMGFESGSNVILSEMNKRFSTDDIAKTADVLGQQGLFRMGFLLLGGPGETKETVQQSVDFAESLALESMKLTVGIRIYPETKLAQQARIKGLIDYDNDLLNPAFYLEPSLDGWLQKKAAQLAAEKENWHM